MNREQARELAIERITRLQREAAENGANRTAFFFHVARAMLIEIDIQVRLNERTERPKNPFVYDMQ